MRGNMLRSILKYFTILFCVICTTKCQNPEVEIPQGRLSGDTRTNFDGGNYYSFLSVPYGKPPIGELRFKAPEPADPWSGTRDATQDLPACVQVSNSGGQEDCLYLNIFTPGLPEENVTQLPVMFWIPGGGFVSGSGSEADQGAQFLLTKDVVLVTISYRLGSFGFLSLDDPNLGVTGNAGLKDQILALEWVQNNIEFFGGDRNNVLIFGESAGSMSVQLLLLSPMSRGLFHKAIAQSGDSLTGLIDPVTRNNAVFLANELGIQTDDWEAMLTSLQEVSVEDLSVTEAPFNPTFMLFAGPIDEVPSNVGRNFLTVPPIDVIRSGTYNRVPFIIGFNDAEGLLFQMVARQDGENLFIDDFATFVPNAFNFGTGSTLEALTALVIRNFYYGDTEPSRDDITGAVELTTDYGFAFPTYRTIREYGRTATEPIYLYYFTAITELNLLKSVDETIAAFPGAGHADDLGYLFYIQGFTPVITPGSVEERGFRNIVELWTNFAIYGNPTPEDSSAFIWEPVRGDEFNYLHIATEEVTPILNDVPTRERLEFWWALFEQFEPRK